MLQRNGELIARVPVAVDEHGAIQFVADLHIGEKFRIGYGDPTTIVENANATQKVMRDFDPEVIFLYTCGCRRFLMQNDVNLETEPFESIAPTVGFYTYGEFYGYGDNLCLLNSAMVVVGMREGNSSKSSQFTCSKKEFLKPESTAEQKDEHNLQAYDPYANKHSTIISRLVHFINAVTSELEEANEKLRVLLEIDKLTQIYNRLKLDYILQSELQRVCRYHYELSIILADIDHFKQVNDVYGHDVGDQVLVQMARVLQSNIRTADFIGRFGGEEFLVIMPHTNREQACIVAEKLRKAVETEVFPLINHKTCSFGVTSYLEGENQNELIKRADEALYKAKGSGRNRVICV